MCNVQQNPKYIKIQLFTHEPTAISYLYLARVPGNGTYNASYTWACVIITREYDIHNFLLTTF